MLRRAYQLRNIINIWVEKFLTDAKIQAIQLKKNEWSLVLLVNNIRLIIESSFELTFWTQIKIKSVTILVFVYSSSSLRLISF